MQRASIITASPDEGSHNQQLRTEIALSIEERFENLVAALQRKFQNTNSAPQQAHLANARVAEWRSIYSEQELSLFGVEPKDCLNHKREPLHNFLYADILSEAIQEDMQESLFESLITTYHDAIQDENQNFRLSGVWLSMIHQHVRLTTLGSQASLTLLKLAQEFDANKDRSIVDLIPILLEVDRSSPGAVGDFLASSDFKTWSRGSETAEKMGDLWDDYWKFRGNSSEFIQQRITPLFHSGFKNSEDSAITLGQLTDIAAARLVLQGLLKTQACSPEVVMAALPKQLFMPLQVIDQESGERLNWPNGLANNFLNVVVEHGGQPGKALLFRTFPQYSLKLQDAILTELSSKGRLTTAELHQLFSISHFVDNNPPADLLLRTALNDEDPTQGFLQIALNRDSSTAARLDLIQA